MPHGPGRSRRAGRAVGQDRRVDHDALDRDGYLVVPGVLTPAEADAATTRALARAADPTSLGPTDEVHGGTIHLVLRDPAVDALEQHPTVRAAVAHLLGSVPALDQAAFRCPQPGHGEQQLHADAPPLERVGPAVGVTAILALVAFTDQNGPTTVVPGSHLRPDQQRPHVRARLGHREVALTGPAGTAFVFTAHLLHRGSRNRSDAPRPAVQAIWRRAGDGPGA